MKIQLQKLQKQVEGAVLPLGEHRSVVLGEEALRRVGGGIDVENQGSTPSCSPSADDCQD